MVSTVTLRPNHYEVLGLTPSATGDEIAQAFAKELGLLRPRAFGSLAEVTVAYETLRDPAKRKAYDASLGLNPQPQPPTPPAPDVPAEWVPFLVRASAKPAEQPRVDPLPPPSPQANLLSQPVLRPATRTAPSATALLRQPIRPLPREIQPVLRTKPEELRRPERIEEPKFDKPERETTEPEPQTDDLLHFAEAGRAHGPRQSWSEWRLPAIAAGALALAVGVGAWTGWEAGNDSEQGPEAVTLKVPKAKAVAAAAESSPAAEPGMTGERPEQPDRSDAATARTEPAPSAPKPVASSHPRMEAVQPVEITPVPVATASSPAEPATTRMPLPNSVIARTIGRIGYPCGQVASTAPVEGAAPGVFKVTCTSGHSYRAAPVNGRYRFRRLSGR